MGTVLLHTENLHGTSWLRAKLVGLETAFAREAKPFGGFGSFSPHSSSPEQQPAAPRLCGGGRGRQHSFLQRVG